MNSDNDDALDSSILSLERLVLRIGSAPLNGLDAEICAVAAETMSLIDKMLPKDESVAWNAEARSIVENGDHAHSESQRSDKGRSQRLAEACFVEACGLLGTGTDMKKGCVHGCGVRFCGSRCWKMKRSAHQTKCNELRRRYILRTLGIVESASDDLF
jgi:hypothetical protein